MKLKTIVIAGSASLLLLGCASPHGGTDETSLETEEPIVQQPLENATTTNEGVYPAPMSTPNMPSGMNLRDLRDSQSMTVPGPPLGPRP